MSGTEIDYDMRVVSLPRRRQIAFAATCAEHLLPMYEKFSIAERWGSTDALCRALDEIWRYLMGHSSEPDLRKMLTACEMATPDMDDFHTELASLALDVAIAVQSAVEACFQADPTAKALEAKAIIDEAIFAFSQRQAFKEKRLVVADVTQFAAQLDDAAFQQEAIFQDSVLNCLETGCEIDMEFIEVLRKLARSYPSLL
jgi:uncharacterized protein YjaG (DUF416 family)